MPKETKRFINPLLRPSSNVEVEETKSEPIQKQSEPQTTSTKTTTDTSTVTSTEISVPPIREAVPPPRTIPEAYSASPDARVVEPQSPINDFPASLSMETSTSTPQIEMEVQRESQVDELLVNEPRAEIRKAPPEIKKSADVMIHPSSAPGDYVNNTMPGPEPEARAGHPSTFPPSAAVPSPVSSVLPQSSAAYDVEGVPSLVAEETTFAAPLPQTSTYTYGGQVRPSRSTEYDEFGGQEYYTPPPVRRRRGAQSFEKTHERITVWVDKRLKQAFEELAYTEETSKTALLNEALADLLRKHSSR